MLSIGTKIGDLEWPWAALMAIILRYFAEFGSFRGPLPKSGWRYADTFSDRNVAQRI